MKFILIKLIYIVINLTRSSIVSKIINSSINMEMFIVNLTTQSFIRYAMENETDKGYNKKLLELLTPPDKERYSHWFRGDKIVFCPQNLYNYVEKNYSEIYLQ